MYTKQDLLENQKMNEIIKQNKIKVREEIIKRNKQTKRHNILLFVSSSLFYFGLMFLISLIENMRF